MDELHLGRFYEGLASELRSLYRQGLPRDSVLRLRAQVFARARARLRDGLGGQLQLYSGAWLAARPLNNASVLAALLYRTRLDAFDALYRHEGESVRRAVAALVAARGTTMDADPYAVLDSLLATPSQ
jgi:predicted aminopeptidase